MTKILAILRPASIAYAAAALVAVLEALLHDPDLVRTTLIISLATLPSILAYAICAELAPNRKKLRHALFIIPVALVLAVCLAAQTSEGAFMSVPTFFRWIFLGYALQIIPAYLVLLATSGKQP